MAAATDLAISGRRPQMITGIALVAMIRSSGNVCGGGGDKFVDMKVPCLVDEEVTRKMLKWFRRPDALGG